MSTKSYTLGHIAQFLQANLRGDAKTTVSGIAPLHSAQSHHISFLENKKYREYLSTTQAAAVIIRESEIALCSRDAIVVPDPNVAYAKVANLFNDVERPAPGIHPTAVIEDGCEIHPSVHIGAHCVIDKSCKLAQDVVIEAGCVLKADCEIAQGSYLYPRVTLYHRTKIGERVTLHSGVVLGSDGFGLAREGVNWVKIPQLGRVVIGDDVEIGANTTIDRGALEDTVIENGVKLDNQIMIGHNVRIGENTAIAACTAIAGSTSIGKNCLLGGAAAISGHINIVDNVMLSAMSGVTNSIKQPGIYSSGMPIEANLKWRKNMARLRHLDEFVRKLNKLELLVKEKCEDSDDA